MSRFSSLRVRLVGTVLVAVVAGWLIAFVADLEVAGFAAGLLALIAAWIGGEWFIVRQVRALLQTATRLARGDLTARTGAKDETGELGDLARVIDTMANSLSDRVKEREKAELSMRNRAQQQTAVAALGQFALVSNDLDELIHQTVMLVAQTLEVEFTEVVELTPDRGELFLRAGIGWKDGLVGRHKVPMQSDSIPGRALQTLEAIRVEDYRSEKRFTAPTLARYHGALSGMTVPITGRDRIRPFGVLGAHSATLRKFTDDDEQFLRAVANVLAMTIDRKRAEAEMHKRAVFAQLNPTPAIEVNVLGEVTYANAAALRLAQDVGRPQPRDLLPENAIESIESVLDSGEDPMEMSTQLAGRTLSWLIHPVPADRLVHCYITDTTERLKMEASLRQADKMLAIGQLAAGVAHDFNNMLTVIQGHAGILMQLADREGRSNDSAQAIYFAAERAAGLTRQLLMFSRKNVKQLGPVMLPEVVNGMRDMLTRLLGETITMEFTAPPTVPRMEADKNEIEQVIMNLVVNARDAMPQGGGILRIDVDSITISEEELALQPQARVGQFVRLRVADSGCGMDQATIDRIFEPFFTTKEVGKGTGLGLATAYGIVKQHEGWIEVESEVGRGTTFSVFFPAGREGASAAPVLPETAPASGKLEGTETILVVEDEDDLRDMALLILDSYGYKSLKARSGPDALEVWKSNADSIELVVTDMVMPGGLTGLQLAEKFLEQRPALPIVITSGYSVDDISEKISGNRNIRFVQKPYSPSALAQAIRDGLDAAGKPPVSSEPQR
jgi:signal transduction histidine kinase/CheY-like chemotaxis protein